jgi:hypothetical protein
MFTHPPQRLQFLGCIPYGRGRFSTRDVGSRLLDLFVQYRTRYALHCRLGALRAIVVEPGTACEECEVLRQVQSNGDDDHTEKEEEKRVWYARDRLVVLS